MLVKLLPFERMEPKSLEIFNKSRESLADILLQMFLLMKIRQFQTSETTVQVRLKSHLAPYIYTFNRSICTSPRDEVTTFPISKLLTGLEQLWGIFLTILKTKSLVFAGVAVDPDNEEEEALVVFKEEGKVGSINHSVLHNHEYRF